MNRAAAEIATSLVLASLLGCDAAPPAPPTAGEAPTAAPAEQAAPTEQAAPAEQAAGQIPAAVANGGPFSGTVVETMNAAGYTYVLLDVGEGQYWVAAQQLTVAVGDRVEVGSGNLMRQFHSSSLNRTFDPIVFASQARVAGSAPPIPAGEPLELPEGHPSTLPSGHPPVGNGTAPAVGQ